MGGMMHKKSFLMICLVFLAGLLVASSALAGMRDVQSRMEKRRPEIKSLKAKGAIGENNQGYLAARSAEDSIKAFVDAENADRRKVYGALAKKMGTSREVVGLRRAGKIAKRARPGTWLQDASGKWYKK